MQARGEKRLIALHLLQRYMRRNTSDLTERCQPEQFPVQRAAPGIRPSNIWRVVETQRSLRLSSKRNARGFQVDGRHSKHLSEAIIPGYNAVAD